MFDELRDACQNLGPHINIVETVLQQSVNFAPEQSLGGTVTR